MTSHTPILHVDLDAIAANWRLLSARHTKGISAAVVKADAYGLGMVPVAKRLAAEGCDTFFVATLEEGIALREGFRHGEEEARLVDRASHEPAKAARYCEGSIPEQGALNNIYIFGGLLRGEEKAYAEHHLSPVLNTLEQVKRYDAASLPPAALHIDTGMCRLGLNVEEAEQAAGAKIALLMTHLACASTPEHPLNAKQLQRFEEARKHFPGVPCSVANSAGLFLDAAYHYELGRPGCALYGITPNSSLPNPMRQVATLKAPILELRTAERDQTVGYGATASVKKGGRILTIGLGYADGLQRIAGNSDLQVFVGDYALPILGRVSMDLTCWDASDVPEQLLANTDHVTVMDDRQPVDKIAEICHTIGYEIFTRLGARVMRSYE